MEALIKILDSSLNEIIRKQEGGAYVIFVTGAISEYPKGQTVLQIILPTEPGKEDYLNSLVKQTVNNMALYGPNAEELKIAINYLNTEQDKKIRDNSYWTSSIAAYYAIGLDNVTGYKEILNSIEAADIKAMATKLIKDNLVEVNMRSKQNL